MPLIWLLFLAGCLSHGLLVWANFEIMWRSEQYQFFPVAIAAAAALLYSRRSELRELLDQPNPPKPNPFILAGALTANAVLLALAILLGRPPAGWLSFIMFMGNLVYASYGWPGWKICFPALFVLVIIRPMPSFLESPLTTLLQQIATRNSSYLLDAIGILHFRQGAVLVLPEQSFMAEEACSGIRSLFSSVTAIVCWGFFHRYHWLHHVLNILQTVLWVIVFNAIRILLVIAVEDKTDFSMATGFAHDCLGLGIFFCIFGMVLSTDQLLGAVHNRFMGTIPQQTGSTLTATKWSDWLSWRSFPLMGKGCLVVFALLAMAELRLQTTKGSYLYNSLAAERTLVAPTQDFLPEEVSGWKVVSFDHIHRENNHRWGSDSYAWGLENGERRIILSIDGSFDDYHELAICYRSIGWSVERFLEYTPLQERISNDTSSKDELTRLVLTKNTGEEGLVLFTALDRDGVNVYYTDEFVGSKPTRLLYALKAIFGTEAALRKMTFRAPVSTVQMVYLPSKPVEDVEVQELRKLFLVLRELLRESPRFKN